MDWPSVVLAKRTQLTGSANVVVAQWQAVHSLVALWQTNGAYDILRRLAVHREPCPRPHCGNFNSSPEVIRLVVMMYVRFPLRLRKVEDLLFERGLDICQETVRMRWDRFGPMFSGDIAGSACCACADSIRQSALVRDQKILSNAGSAR
jgi:hypothetical protein